MSAAALNIDTPHVPNRRKLYFHSIEEALDEANRLALADKQGRLLQLGNWTLGQALGHIAAWIEFGYTGFPIKAPFIVRLIVWLQRRKFLYRAMPAGVHIPGIPQGTLATDPISLEEGISRFHSAFQRLKSEPQLYPSPVLGKLTHEESIALNLRHAELHLSFFVPA
jgi:hypothetical protein